MPPDHPALAADAPPPLPEPRRTWYRWSFAVAAVYNVAWGTTVILLPGFTLSLAGIETDAVGRLFWQCIGMFVLVFAIGYAAAFRQPERYAVFILIALLGKIFGPVGFVYGAFWLGALPANLGWTIITNDLLWWPIWVPFVWETLVRPPAHRRAPPAAGKLANDALAPVDSSPPAPAATAR